MTTFEAVMEKWAPYRSLTSPPSELIVLWKQGTRTIYIEEIWGPAVPYLPAYAPDRSNHGYRNVKGDMQAVASIPEVQGWPELQGLLEAVNVSSSPLESVGCEKAFFSVEGDGDINIKLCTYCDVIVTDRRQNEHPENLVWVAAFLMDSLDGCENWWTVAEAGLQRLRHLSGTNVPWSLMLRVCNHGRNEHEARSLFGETLRRLSEAIRSLPKELPPFPLCM